MPKLVERRNWSQTLKNTDKKNPVFVQNISNQDGVVLVTALLMLVVLTIMGVAAISVRNTEQSITLNSEVFQHNFYSVEAVTLEGVAEVEKLSDAVLNNPGSYPSWLRQDNPAIDLENSSQWPSGLIIPRNTALTLPATNITPGGYASNGTSAGDRIWSAAIDQGLASGSSVTYGAGGTTLEKMFDVYGMYDVKPGGGKSYHGKMMLVVGYKKQVQAP